ncbi:Metallophosphoesterase [uncultured Paludibacter sp.]|nr:Metallophosphoesterase [uncultured Paludibacter sp.]
MIYFISDAHLGSRMVKNPREHELHLVRWLEKIKTDAEAIYLMGDMFDFWFEYKTVVPKGFVRFLGKLAELSDSGIEIHFFTGNHDIWTFGYLEKEIGLIVHTAPFETEIKGKKFFLAHGDGLSMDDHGFKLLRKIFHSHTAQKLFRLVPPQLGQDFGYAWSKRNRQKILMHYENKFEGEDNEFLVKYAKKYIQTHDVDYLVFGHRHIELNLQISKKSSVIILGDFVDIFSYGVFDGEKFWLENF